MKPLPLSVSLWALLVFSALLKICDSQNKECNRNETQTTTTTTTVNLTSQPNCTLIIGKKSYRNGSISQLIPGKVYTISFQCLNCSTNVTMKPENVTNLSVTDITTSSMSLTWTTHNFTTYIVTWTDGNKSESKNMTADMNISHLTAGVMYSVTVTPLAEDGLTKGGEATVSSYTRPEVVRNLTVTEITTSSLSLNWTKPEGYSVFYIVKWSNGTLTDNVTKTQKTIFNLTAGVHYDISVAALAADGRTDGQISNVSQYTRPEVVRNLTVTEITTSSLSLNWTKPEGHSSFYIVKWSNGTLIDNVTKTQKTISNLTAGVHYDISVAALAADGRTDGQISTVSQNTRPEVVRNLTVTEITTSSLSLNWTKPEGHSSFYIVKWSNGTLIDNVTTTQKTISNLTAGVHYDISVAALAADGRTDGQISTVSQNTRPEVVRNLTVTEITTSSLSLNWTKPEGYSSFYIVKWSNGTLTDNVTTTQKTITNLTAGAHYDISVAALAADGRTDGQISNVSQNTRPEVVRNLTVTEITTSSLSLNWTKPEGHSSFYIVKWSNGTLIDNVTKTQKTISNLTAGAHYDISVAALAADGRTDGQISNVSQNTRPEVVRNLTVTEITTSSLSLNWTKPEGHSSFYIVKWSNGTLIDNVTTTQKTISNLTAGVHYDISVAALAADGRTDGQISTLSQNTRPEVVRNLTVTEITTSSLSLNWTKPEGYSSFYIVKWSNGTLTDNVTTTQKTITNLTAGAHYDISVAALAADGRTDGQISNVSQNTRPEVVRNLTVTEITTSSLSLNWTKPEGHSSFYIVKWSNGTLIDNVTKTQKTISNLTAGAHYDISVAALAADGRTDGQISNVSQNTRPEVVRNLTVTEITTSSLSLNWTKPEGYSSFYIVKWSNGTLTDNVTTTQKTITNLTAGAHYDISVAALAADGRTDGQISNVSQNTRPEVVRNLTVTEITTSSLSLNWTKPEGYSSFYIVKWSNGTLTDNVTTTQKTITNLTAGAHYDISVAALAADGRTDGQISNVSQNTRPEVVRNLTVTEITTSSLSLNWTKPEGHSSFYIVKWSNGTLIDNVTKTQKTISNLTAGAHYDISVAALAADGRTDGQISNVSQNTRPEVVRNLTVTEITTSSLSLNWTKPEGHSSFYILKWSNGTLIDNVTTTQKTISNLTAGVHYDISVAALAADGRTDGQISNVSQNTRPEVVRNLTVTEITTSSLSLNWTKPEGCSSFYIVKWSNGTLTDNVTKTQKTIFNLTAGVHYDISVAALAADGRTDGQISNVSQYTRPEVVRNLTVTEITTSSLSVNWTKPEGYSSFYIVKWSNGTLTVNVTTTQKTITNLTAGVHYDISVAALAADGRTDGQISNVSQYTRPEVVRNLTVTEITTSSLSLNWTKPEGCSSFYIVKWSNGTLTDNVTKTQKTIFNLTAGVHYDISVAALAADGRTDGQISNVSQYTRPEVVRNLTVTEITTSSLSVNWTKPEGYSSFYIVKWSNGTLTVNVTTTQKTITNLTAGVHYDISVAALAADGRTDGQISNVSQYTRPEVVRNLTVTEITTSSLSLNWTKPEGHSSFYIVKWSNGTLTDNVTKTQKTIFNLTAGVHYDISVAALAADGRTDGQISNVSQYTRPEVVRNLTVTEITTSSLSVNWTKPEGYSSFYIVKWSNGTLTDNVTTTQKTITNLTAGIHYDISVAALAADGRTDGQISNVSQYTRPEVVRNLTVTEITTSSLSVNWTKPEGYSSFYIVKWSNGTLTDNVTTTQKTITNLTAGIHYDISVAALAADGRTDGQISNVSQYTRPEVVRNLTVTEITTSSLSLNWTKPEGYSSFYIVKWSNGTLTDNVTKTQKTISNLTAGVHYDISVAALAADGRTDGQISNVSQYTRPDVVRNLTVTEITTSSLSLNWTKPEGYSSFYIVKWSNGTLTDNVTKTQKTIFNLTAGVHYDISVAALAADGRTDGQISNVSQYTRPEVVRNLTVTEITTSSLSLNWTKPEGHSSFYIVKWSNGTLIDNVTKTQKTIFNLTAGVHYDISVAALAADGRTDGQISNVSQYTRPEVVRNLTVTEFTTSSLSLNWTKPEGHSSFYIVKWSNGTLTDNVTKTQKTIFNLTAGVLYDISVAALAADGRTDGQISNVSQYTRPEVVRNLTVTEITTSSLSLNWTKPEGYSSFYIVKWSNGTLTDNVTNTQKTIFNLTAGVHYDISVAALAADGRTDGQISNVSQYTRPEVVRNLTVTEITTSSLSLNWTKPEGYSSFYIVKWSNGTLTDNVTKTQKTISNLTAGVHYDISVAALAADGRTDGQISNVSQYTRPEVVRNLTVTEITTSSLSLNWTKPEGYSSFYIVKWSNGTLTDNVTKTQKTIFNLTAGVHYDISVAALAADGRTDGQISNVSQYTRPEVVRNLTVTEITTSSLSLNWTKPEGYSSFYIVKWSNGTLIDNVTKTQKTIFNLTAGVHYDISVAALAADGRTDGQISNVSQYTRPEVVRNLTVTEITTSSLSLNWTKPEGYSSFYIVKWSNGTLTDNVTKTQKTIFNLTAGVHYDISVAALAADGRTDGQISNVSQYTRPEVVRNLTVTEITTSSLSLNWTKPEGYSSFYIVKWSNGTLTDNVTKTQKTISNLTAGVHYDISVAALAADGRTDGQISNVSQYTKPGMISNPIVSNTATSIFVNWTAPPGQVFEYRVTYNNSSPSIHTAYTFAMISDLIPGTIYTITVIAIAGDNSTQGAPLSFSSVTKPEAVNDLTVTNTTTSSLSLNWTPPYGSSSFYIVQWSNGTSIDNVTQTNIIITGLTAGVQYTISVIAVAADNLTVGQISSVSQYTRPGVIDSHLESKNTSSISLNWSRPSGEVFMYRVEWNNDGVPMYRYTNYSTIVLSDLIPGTKYNIIIFAVNGNDITGDPYTFSSVTEPEVVQNLSITNITSTSVSLAWTEPVGNATSYSVQWTPKEGKDSTNTTSITIKYLKPGFQYNITVAAVAENSTGRGSSITTFTRPDQPEDIISTAPGTRNLNISWTLPTGRVDHYVVNISNAELRYFNSHTTTVNMTSFTDLKPGRVFDITVTAVAGSFYNRSVQTSHATRPIPPHSIIISQRTNSSLSLNWPIPELMAGAPNIIYYITYQVEGGEVQSSTIVNNISLSSLSSGTYYSISLVTGGPQNLTSTAVYNSSYTQPNPVLNLVASPKSTTSVEVKWSYPHKVKSYYKYRIHVFNTTATINSTEINSTNETVIGNLEPGTRYSIKVTTIASNGIESTEEETSSYTMPKAVTNLIAEFVNTTAIKVTWLRQSDHKPSYTYEVIALLGATMVKNGSTEHETYTFSRLTPGTLYTFKVFTVVEEVKSTVESTKNYTKPEAVSNITVIGSTTNLSVHWIPASGEVAFYTVLVYRDSQLVKNSTDLSSNTVEELFLGLMPGVHYCVMVVTKSGPLETNSSTVCSVTFPNPPGAIMVDSQTVESINFTWSLPDGMDHNQYNFSVSTFNGSVLTENNWFLLDNLQSGTPYNISVVTVGLQNYESTAVTTEKYTRPYPVTKLKEAEITTDAVKLVWEQPERKPHYYYSVQTSNSSIHVTDTMSSITGLNSGTNYSFTVITHTADGTQSAPVTVSYFTRPYGIRQLEAETLNTTAVRLVWAKPLQDKAEYTYRVETTGFQNITMREEVATIAELTPGANHTFCVLVIAANGIEGEPVCTSQYTKPEIVQPSVSSQGSNSSILVSWTKPPGRVEYYMVHLNGTPTVLKEVSSNSISWLFEGLSAGRLYTVIVTTFSGPFNASSEFVTNATFPNPPGPIEILMKTVSSIQIRWKEALFMTNASFKYLLSKISQGDKYIHSTTATHNFTSLLSGTSYNISVATEGVMDFQSEKVEIYKVTTRPFSVNSLSTVTDMERIKVKWTKPEQYKESYRFNVTSAESSFITEELMYIIGTLVPGTQYNFSVTTETSDGTKGASRWISSCTNASPVKDFQCEGPNKTKAEIMLSWKPPKGQHSGFNITVNNGEIINTPNCCNHTVSNLHHYTKYELKVVSLSCGQPSTPVIRSCRTGITAPPILQNYKSLSQVRDLKHSSFYVHVNSSLLAETNGPITDVGVLVTKAPAPSDDSSQLSKYLVYNYEAWKENKAPVYLATVKTNPFTSRSQNSDLAIHIGDEDKWHSYTNGLLDAKGKYQYAIVLFTYLVWNDNVVDDQRSLVSITNFYPAVELPNNPAVIGIAVGATLGIFCVLFIILIGFIIYWKRVSNKENTDIQIHSIRAKVSVAVRVEDYEAYYKKQKADSNCGFAEEFEDLKLVGTAQAKTNALNVDNKPKNRYNNVLPYDSSRVKLSIIHGSPYDDYINANYMPGYNSRKEFIAAQGPLPATVKDFWRMVWEKNVQTLIMLTRCNEQGRVKCEKYWDYGTKHFDNITVTTTSEIPLEDWTIRDFDIKNVKTAETRSVRHFHFTAWPDHGVPETTELLISFRHLVREHMDQYSRHSPAVVHCSAGVGRTGTFIAIDRLIFQIERENIVDVYGIVYDLRMHRPLMVQTEDQYVFLNQCAMDIIKSRTGTNVDLIYQNTAALSIYENVDRKNKSPKNGYHDEQT